MKKFMLITLLFISACSGPKMVPESEYLRLEDSVQHLTETSDSLYNQIRILEDSIRTLSQKQLTAEQFIRLYKYDRLYKYYRICQKNPTQWKYYKGWSIRVFEN